MGDSPIPLYGVTPKDGCGSMDRYRNVIFSGRPHVRSCPVRAVVAPPIRSVCRPYAESEVVSAAEGRFIAQILSCAGVDASMYRLSPLKRRLAACLRALKVPDISAAERVLANNPRLCTAAIDALLIGVTRFYRDRDVFDDLRSRWVPDLLGCRRGLKAWSVGSSDGAELYSVAAILAERGALEASTLLGTDCRQSAIDSAHQATYSPSALIDLPEELRTRYFVKERGALIPAGVLRQASMRWMCQDALACLDHKQWDLILCRNMAIYLSPPVQAKLWLNLRDALRPGGILVSGRAERPGCAGLQRISICTYRRESN